MSYECYKSLPPADKELVETYVNNIKSQGLFDQFRKECQADVDTKPAYQNLQQRVENTVSKFLSTYKWQENLNKTQIRERLRKHVQQDYLENGVDRIVDQVVNPKIYSVFMPKVGDIVYESLGIERPKHALESSKAPNILLNRRPAVSVEIPNETSTVTQLSSEGGTVETTDKGKTPEHVAADLPLHDDLEPVSPGEVSLADIGDNSNTVTNDETETVQGGPYTPEKGTKETIGEDAVDEDEDDDEDASPAFEPIITNKDSKMSLGGLSEVSREDGSVFANMNEPTNEKKFDNFSNLDEKIKQCEVNLTERKPEDEPSNSSDSKAEDTVKGEVVKGEKEAAVKQISEDSTSSLGEGRGSAKKHESSSSHRKSESSDKKTHDSHRDSRDKGKSSSSSSRHKSSSSSRHHSSSKDRKDDHKSSRSSSSKDERRDDKKDDKKHEKKDDKKDDRKEDRKNVDRKDDKKDERRDKKDDKSTEKRKEGDSKSSSRSHDRKSDSRHSSSSRSSDKKPQSKETKDKEDEERKKEAKKRRGERCADGNPKNPRRSSDRDNNGGQGSTKPNKSSSSNKKCSSSTSKTDKSEASNDKSTGGDDQQHDEETPADKTDEIDLILMQINSQIERDEKLLLNCKKPKIANNFQEMKKVMKARRMMEKEFSIEMRVSGTEENKENDHNENRPKQGEEDSKEKSLPEGAVVQTLTERRYSSQDKSEGCSPEDFIETSKLSVPISLADENSQSCQSDKGSSCSSHEPFFGFEVDSEESDHEVSPYKKFIDDIMKGKKECFISLAKIGLPSSPVIEDELLPLAEPLTESVEKTREGTAYHDKTTPSDACPMLVEEAKKGKFQKTSITSEEANEEENPSGEEDSNPTKQQSSQKGRKVKNQVPVKNTKVHIQKNKTGDTKVTLNVRATVTRMQKDRLISETESTEEIHELRTTSETPSANPWGSEDVPSKRKGHVDSSDNEENLSSRSLADKPSKKPKKSGSRAQVATSNVDSTNNNGGSQDKNKMEQTKRSSQRYDNEDLYKPRPVLSHHNSRRFRGSNADASGSNSPQIPLLGLRQRNRTR